MYSVYTCIGSVGHEIRLADPSTTLGLEVLVWFSFERETHNEKVNLECVRLEFLNGTNADFRFRAECHQFSIPKEIINARSKIYYNIYSG